MLKPHVHPSRRKYARIAGLMLLLYIAVGITQTLIGGVSGETTAAKLASMVQHAANVRINVILTLATCFIALVLGVALHALTRIYDADLAMLALVCRVGEGVFTLVSVPLTLALLAFATTTNSNNALDSSLLAVLFTARTLNPIISALFFAVGSAFFSWLLLRGALIPSALAWLGVFASGLLVVGLPLQIGGVLPSSIAALMWLPMLVFEVPLGLWLLIKGVNEPPHPLTVSTQSSRSINVI